MAPLTMPFKVPEALNADRPPERRGLRRDHVRMLVTERGTGLTHDDVFYRLPDYLKPGDLVVLNNSRTIPAVLRGRAIASGRPVEIRLARPVHAAVWEAMIVTDGVQPGDEIVLSTGVTIRIGSKGRRSPFHSIEFSLAGEALWNAIYEAGEPVRYEYIHEPWPLSDYQTVFGAVPGSVEMPSAGRPFSWELLQRLREKGIGIGFLQLHTGLSYVPDEPYPVSPKENTEAYHIPAETIARIRAAKEQAGRVIAVGTTVVRALETAAMSGDFEKPSGTTNLYIDASFALKVVDGLITGLHEPESSHLDLLTAFLDAASIETIYRDAVAKGYLWHEFGDVHVIL